MNLIVLLFIVYMAFSIVATGFYLYYVGFNKDDMFVLKMERVEQIKFVCAFSAIFMCVLYYLLNFSFI